jgi:catechol 2,3-dioxygenase-like lactoylglutathione lyase family enzyme
MAGNQEEKMTTPKLTVISLWAEDVPATAHFYRDVIGLKLLPHHGGRPHFDLDGVYLTILQGQPQPAQEATPERFPLFAWVVDDLDGAIQRLHAHQIGMPWGIEGDARSRWVMFHDPAGNLIELVQFS